jgi:hypothetical protein
MFKKIKPIRHYFPDIVVAKYMIKEGIEKYKNHKRFTLIDNMQTCSGQIFYDGHPAQYAKRFKGKLFISPAHAAIMYATRKEPKKNDLNTPSETYGWDFNETRDILAALNGLAHANPFYWNLHFGVQREIIIKNVSNARL